jgi:hypothetical protein
VNSSNAAQSSQPNRSGNFGGLNNAGNNISDPNLLDSQFLSGGYQSGNGSNLLSDNLQSLNANGSQLGVQSENNQMFEKILSEVIHVSTFDQRSNNVMGMVGGSAFQNGNDMMINQVQEMPFKIRGLQEPQLNKQQFTLPDGVPAPLSVLAAQPPFLDDIRLINSVAFEANNCINNYSLAVPENVAFDFKPVNL